MADMRTPDIAGEITAFRAWLVEAGWRRAMLRSFNWTFWPPDGWLVAECKRADCDIPGEHCSCGIYAARHRQHLHDIGYLHQDTYGMPVVVGEVGLVGKVIPGTLGWRAARARVTRLWVSHEHRRLTAPLSAAYQVPVTLMPSCERS